MHARDAGLMRHALRTLAEVAGATAAPLGGHGLAVSVPRKRPLLLVRQSRGRRQFRRAQPGGGANINRTSISRQTFNSRIFRRAVTVNRSVTANGGCCSSNWRPIRGGAAAEPAVAAGTVAPGMR